MSNTVNFDELDGQHVELLPARTVLSVFSAQIPVGDAESITTGNGPNTGGDAGALVTGVTGIGGMNSGDAGSNTDGGSGAENS
jgi:hypothetical protein